MEIMEMENPCLPDEEAPEVQKRTKFIPGEEIIVRPNGETTGDVLVKVPEKINEGNKNTKEVKVSKMFEDWDKMEEVQEEKPAYELKLPELNEGERE